MKDNFPWLLQLFLKSLITAGALQPTPPVTTSLCWLRAEETRADFEERYNFCPNSSELIKGGFCAGTVKVGEHTVQYF